MSKDTGGQAFPTLEKQKSNVYEIPDWKTINGMTLRDYFAGQAVAGLLANQGRKLEDPDVIAATAYNIADAMLAQRTT